MNLHHFVNLEVCSCKVIGEEGVSLLLCIQQEHIRCRLCTEPQDCKPRREKVPRWQLLACWADALIHPGNMCLGPQRPSRPDQRMENFKQISQNSQPVFILRYFPSLIPNANSPEILGDGVLPHIDNCLMDLSVHTLGGLPDNLFSEYPTVTRSV